MLVELIEEADLGRGHTRGAKPLHPARGGLAGEAALELRHQREALLALGHARRQAPEGWPPMDRRVPSTAPAATALAFVQAGEDEEAIRGGVGAVVGLELLVGALIAGVALEVVGGRQGRVGAPLLASGPIERLDRDEPLRLDRQRGAEQGNLDPRSSVASAPQAAPRARRSPRAARR